MAIGILETKCYFLVC